MRGLALGEGGLCVGSARVFRYKHVVIGNIKVSRWESKPTQGPNTRGFALQWNIGLNLSLSSEF